MTAGSCVGAESPALATISSTSSLPGAEIAEVPAPESEKERERQSERERVRERGRGRERERER